MRTRHGLAASAFLFVSWLGIPGCLPAMPNDPQSLNDPSANPATGTGSGGGDTTDMGGAPIVDDLGGATAADLGGGGDMAVVCDKVQSTAGLSKPSGEHNPGQECQGCHAGGGAPRFTLGGTIYSAATGGTAVAGATINVTDAAGKVVKIVSANNGNFWTTTALTFPIKVNASLCPAALPMIAPVSGNGACNNCHNNTFRVHVP